MKTRVGLLLTCATSALVIGAGSLSVVMAADMPVKAEVPVAEGWWYTAYVETGGRFFVNNPQKNGIASQGGQSLAKYYEYSSIKPGPFGDFHFGVGTNSGLYQADVWGKNVGYSDQSYLADMSVAGEHYLTLGWDETPHVYSMSALTLYNGVGGNALTLPAGLSNKLFTDCLVGANCPATITAAGAAAVQRDINQNVHQTDIGIRRDTASVEYRWTPTDAWDIRAYYTNLHRIGTQVDGVVFSPGTSGVVSQVPKPVDDTTQNYGLSGEYAGTSLWGQRYNFQVAYGGSTYTDNFSSYTVQNPFCPTGAVNTDCGRTGSLSPPTALMSLPPDNQANSVTGQIGADLPWNSRYMGTVSYNMMRQNQTFLPFTLTPFTTSGGIPPAVGTPWQGVTTIPVNNPAAVAANNGGFSSLNGQINTLLVNNVVTTQITPELK
jgi:MtrB/PioB family decaheme-associated outer membrane protein